MFKEFKEFALKGNAIELAIGVVVGGAFQSIVNSLVNDIIMPLLSLLTGDLDFSEWVLKIGTTSIPYGAFIAAIVNFLIVAFTLFLVVRNINRLNKKMEEAKIQETMRLTNLAKKSKLLGKLGKKGKQEETEEEIEEIKEEATTKYCPFCFSEININATRCPHCTSKLDEEE